MTHENEEKRSQYLSGRECGELYNKGLIEPGHLEELAKEPHSLNWHIGFKEAVGRSLINVRLRG